MAHLTADRHMPLTAPTADPGRQRISFAVGHLTITLLGDEARQWGDQYNAALAELAVKGAPELAQAVPDDH